MEFNSPRIIAATIEPDPSIDSVGLGREGDNAFDIGAYEYQDPPTATSTNSPTPSPTYPTDINLDGTVNAEDLLILLEDWGRVSGAR
ncbi:MAG: hypothetical protein KC940_06490 [Candidatus Omnitrophica bacterium]|nr:hypothetical protein [Candidatus Omnitrophota bacterium]